MNVLLWLGIAVLVAVAGVAALRFRGALGGRRPSDGRSLHALPDGWLDLGVLPVPYAGRRPLDRMLQAFLDVTPSPFASAVRGARTRLVLEGGDRGRGVVLLSPSCEPTANAMREERATSACAWVATNLALALGQLGPVLLVSVGAGPTLLDAGVDDDTGGEAQRARANGPDGTRYWRPGMLNLVTLAGAEEVDPEQLARWSELFEWVLVDASGADDRQALLTALPAGTIDVWVVDTQASAAIAAAARRVEEGTRPAVLVVGGA